jgi:uncharacterized protein YutE (UPF0331/DUF86 family)
LNNILKENFESFKKSIYWLKRSYNKCKEIGIKQEYKPDEYDYFENLCSRYGRSIDIFINKVLRSIDIIELENIGTNLDVVNRAEKRGLINSADEVIEMKALRNEIVHEYVESRLIEKFEKVLEFSEKILEFYERAEKYIKKY